MRDPAAPEAVRLSDCLLTVDLKICCKNSIERPAHPEVADRACVCVIGFINTYDSQSYDTNDSHWKYIPAHSTKRNGYKCVCVCVPPLLLLPLSKVLVSSDTTAGLGGAGASITGDERLLAHPMIPST
eukprot:COSAG01_NODE_3326_length_6222_cov_19.423834_6_plen_128_part_00